ncbi:MAG: DUF4276 family protein [bacterium]|nr:DUF4276 family protein [bacterium]
MRMIHINIVIEDNISKAILKVILKQMGKQFEVSRSFPDLMRTGASAGYSYIKQRINGFNNAAKGIPFLVLTDLDQNECAPTLIREWLPQPHHPNLIFRVAVREIESWLMADRDTFAKFLGISSDLIPRDLDNNVEKPKKFLLDLTRRSKKRNIKNAILPKPKSTARVGPDYNGTLARFLYRDWKLNEAVKHSDSLNRAFRALKKFHKNYNPGGK